MRGRSGRPGRARSQTGAHKRDAEAGQRSEGAQGGSREASSSDPATSKNQKNQIGSDVDLFRGDKSEAGAPGGRAPPPCASPRAPCRDGRVERLSTKISWPSRAVAGRALSCGVRDCENDARRCPRRASRGRTGCPRSCPRPWWWRGVTRAAVVEGVGGRAAPVWTHMAIASSATGACFGLVSGLEGSANKKNFFSSWSQLS